MRRHASYMKRNDAMYLALKHAHAGFAYLSILFFFARGGMMLLRPAWLQARPVRILPHVIDTFLLALGVSVAVLMHYSPLSQPWLMAKIIALFFYVGFGTLALRRGRTPAVRATAFAAALGTVMYIVAVAKTKLVWPF